MSGRGHFLIFTVELKTKVSLSWKPASACPPAGPPCCRKSTPLPRPSPFRHPHCRKSPSAPAPLPCRRPRSQKSARYSASRGTRCRKSPPSLLELGSLCRKSPPSISELGSLCCKSLLGFQLGTDRAVLSHGSHPGPNAEGSHSAAKVAWAEEIHRVLICPQRYS